LAEHCSTFPWIPELEKPEGGSGRPRLWRGLRYLARFISVVLVQLLQKPTTEQLFQSQTQTIYHWNLFDGLIIAGKPDDMVNIKAKV